ncbi:hypothetical protein ACIB24_01235 [Spongisporangium articulatum]|uniref:Uncharacterized protein n=1 Tax=Spongisporangium articulatum TaxID=3362603 RepID=A0ABW8AJC5_9ACTN
MDTTIKVSTETRDRIKAIGAQRNQSAEKVILSALDELDRAMFWDAYDAAVAEDGPPTIEPGWEATASDLND